MPNRTQQIFETRRVVVLSWQHLRAVTVDSLKACPLPHWPVMGAPIGPDMLLVYAHTEICGDVPDDMVAAIRWARAQDVAGVSAPEDPGFEYILFDRDADPREDLATFDHADGQVLGQ